jgi:hypothetical protein
MTGPDRADTGRMRSASETIDTVGRQLQEGTGEIVELLERLATSMNEASTSQALRRLGEQLREADTAIHRRILEIGQYLGETATVIDTVLHEAEADRDATARQISGGKYGSALNG